MTSLLNPAKSLFRGFLQHRTHIRYISRFTQPLSSSKGQNTEEEEKELQKVLMQQRYVADEFYEPNPTLASGQSSSVVILNKEESTSIMFNSFNTTGFSLNNGLRVVGPCAALPKSVLHWNIRGVEDINQESLSLFTILEPKIDVLVLGVGQSENLRKVDRNIITYLRSQNISVEILPTEQALSTFNFLNQEARYVAGVFLPPDYMDMGYFEQSKTYLKQDFNVVEIEDEEDEDEMPLKLNYDRKKEKDSGQKTVKNEQEEMKSLEEEADDALVDAQKPVLDQLREVSKRFKRPGKDGIF